MKLLTNARVNRMQAQIRVQALAIKFLKQDNQRLEERVAELETILFCAGRMGKDAVLATDEERTWYADRVIERYDQDVFGTAIEPYLPYQRLTQGVEV